MDAGGAVAMTRHQRRQCDTHLVTNPHLLDGSKRQLPDEVHAWATSQWFDEPSLGAMTLVDCLLQIKIVDCADIPADWSVGSSAAMASLALGLYSE
jgi:hypothetical protein